VAEVRRVDLLEEHITAIFKVTRLEVFLALSEDMPHNGATWHHIPDNILNCYCHERLSQKTAFFDLTRKVRIENTCIKEKVNFLTYRFDITHQIILFEAVVLSREWI
jgi:hypothetical protein